MLREGTYPGLSDAPVTFDEGRTYRELLAALRGQRYLRLPALLGAGATLLSLFLVGAEKMLLPALGVIVLALLLLRRRLDERGTAAGEEASVC